MVKPHTVRFVVLVVAAALLVPAASHPSRATAATCADARPWGSFPRGCTVDDFVAQAKAARDRVKATEYRAASDDHVIVRFTSRAAGRSASSRAGWHVRDEIGHAGAMVLAVPPRATARGFVRSLREREDVRYAELDHRVRPFAQTTDWGAEAMNVPDAHGVNGATGSGITVAVVDTGVDYTHEDLDANIWTNPGETADNGIDDEGNGYVDDVRGWDFIGPFFTSIQPDNDPMDVFGHGTHVSGIVAAEDNGVGILGVAPDATIMPVRVLDDVGAAFDSTIADGIIYAVDNGADVINMSLGGYFPSSLLREACAYAAANDVTVVAAAGNEFFYSVPSFPAGYPSVISVAAASREDETKTWWSNWGNADFLAPGEEVLSSTPDNEYQRFSGTSMASPQVAGAIALIEEINPGFDPRQLEQALASTADDRYDAGKDSVSGSGFPDVEAATGTLPSAQLELYRSKHLVPSDGTTGSEIMLRLLDDTGAPLAAQAGTFSTDVGDLTDTAFNTDGSGEATTTLTATDLYGIATVTATVGLVTRDITVIVEDDRVRIDDAFVSPAGSGGFFFFDSASPPDEGFGEEASVGPVLEPGEDVQVLVYAGNRHFGDTKTATIEWTVDDPNGDPVPELAGESDPVDVGFGGRDFGIWISEERVPSVKLTVPDDAETGRYELTVAATTSGTGLTDSYTRPFWVGESPEVLVVRAPFYFNAETFNYFDFSNPHVNWGIEQRIEDLGRSVAYWDTSIYGEPTGRDLRNYSAIVWLGDWESLPATPIRRYLAHGGNAFVSSELAGTFDRLSGSTTLYQNRFHVTGLLTQGIPSDNHKVYPSTLEGAGPFAGETFDVDSYDLSTTGEPTALFVDELVQQNPGAGVDTAAEFPTGVHDPAIGGVYVDDGSFRSLYTSVGLEAIDDVGSTATAEDVLSTVFDLFAPPPSITGVSPGSITEAGGGFLIEGAGFQQTGATTVELGGEEIPSQVFGRTEIGAAVPYGFPRGTYDVTVRNPFGNEDTLVGALRVTRAAPIPYFVDPYFASNDRDRTIKVFGDFFRPGADVLIAGHPVAEDVHAGLGRIDATLPAGFDPLGYVNVKVVNPDGRAGTLREALLVRYGFTTQLERGDDGVAVGELQKRLKDYGFYPRRHAITRHFGSVTARAVRRFQRAHDLDVTGALDAPTRRRLNNQP